MHLNNSFFRQYRIFNGTMTAILIVAIAAPLCFDIPGTFKNIIPISINPPPCFIREHTGQYCKSCGLLRSIIAVYHGEWSLSRLYHPLGIIFVFVFFFEFLFRIVNLILMSILLLI